MLAQILFGCSVILWIIIYYCCYIEWHKKRTKINEYFISFILPCYNDGSTIEKSIKSIYECYDNFELFVINDCSSDDSLDKIKILKEKYKFNLFDNPCNLGKARSINQVFPLTKGEIIFVLDTDIKLNKEAITDILKRFSFNENVKAVSCPYRVYDKGFWQTMQTLEYNMYAVIHYACNIHSTLSLCGGCLAVKRDVFQEAGLFSENAWGEDTDLAVKINKLGYRVEQSFSFVGTTCPDNFNSWFRQKVRWSSGAIQCLIKYPEVYFKKYLYLAYFLMGWFSLLISLFFIGGAIYNLPDLLTIIKGTGYDLEDIFINLRVFYGINIFYWFFVKFSVLLFSVPYVFILLGDKWKQLYRLWLVFPFCFIYLPIFNLANLYGFVVGIKSYRKLKKGARAW